MNKYGKICALTALMGFSNYAIAASFQIQEQNAKDLGTAYAGAASLGEDASTNFYNPAALTEVTGYNVALSAVALKAKFELNATTSTDTAGGAVPGVPGKVKYSGTPVIPGLHISSQYNDDVTFGFSVVSPYGLKTDYPSDSLIRYAATKSKLQTINFTPSVAYKVNNELSVGLGLDFMQSKIWLDGIVGIASGLGGTTDAATSIYGKDSNFSFHTGVFYKLSDKTQMGLTYHHQHSLHLKGDINAPTNGALAGFAATGQQAKASARLPASLRYSVTHQYDDKWTMVGDLQWTKWSVLKEIFISYNTNAGVASTQRLTFEYKNAWRVALGTHYKHNDEWTFKGGISYDQSPVNSNHKGVRVPDANRFWVALGAKYKINEAFTVDAGYSHLFFKNPGIIDINGARTVIGTGKANANLLGVQLTWNLV
jgi:long-chain fatty acid transport protein